MQNQKWQLISNYTLNACQAIVWLPQTSIHSLRKVVRVMIYSFLLEAVTR